MAGPGHVSGTRLGSLRAKGGWCRGNRVWTWIIVSLLAFVRKRAWQGVLTAIALTLVIHGGVTLAPGDPVRALFGVVAPSPAEYQALVERFGLDQPYPIQYLSYLRELLSGNLGQTISFVPRPVSGLVARAFPITAGLTAAAIALQLGLGYAIAVTTTLRRLRLMSTLTWWMAVVATATPVIVSAFVLRYTFTIGYGGLGWFPFRYNGAITELVLPLVALTAMILGPVVLLMRSEMLQGVRSTFARFAKASGHSERRIAARHVARAAAAPAIAYVGANLGYLLTGVVIVESVFEIPGLGLLIISSIGRRDRAVVVGAVLVVGLLVIAMNALADIAVAWIDPRIRHGSRP